MKKAVQQIMLGTVSKTEKQTLETLKAVKSAGYDGIELNGFMIQPTSFLVRALTKAAGMPVGKGGNYDWLSLVKEAGLEVISIHQDLGSIERDPERILDQAKAFGTNKIVVTGMYRFDYGNAGKVDELCVRLNQAGEIFAGEGVELLYHNHNIEWMNCGGITAYQRIIENTDPRYVNFEFDSYWPTEAGVDALSVMKELGERMRLYHINDRGTKIKKTPITPILKSDSMELGTGNMNLKAMTGQAKAANADAIILESHKNWIDKDPIKSLTVSGQYLSELL